MEIQEIFENLIKIEPKVVSLETLFNNEERVEKTNYKPSYQRNYVWDDEKATYFIESIFLGTEIPPLIYFRTGDRVEVIDGRQRYQTILRFIHNEFKLKKSGLQKLEDVGISNKLFRDIEHRLKELFWDTKLRIIEFSFHNRKGVTEEIEDLVKKEIFKRYNSGITPLKTTEIDRAAYFMDDLNSYIKEKLERDNILYSEVSNLFHFEKSDIEVLLKKIRQLLVQHQIPIKYYAVKKTIVISKYYDLLFSNITNPDIEEIYDSFLSKINFLLNFKRRFGNDRLFNRLISECLFWALSIFESEGFELSDLNDDDLDELAVYISKNSEHFKLDRSSFAKELFARYGVTAKFFEQKYSIDFEIYLQYTEEFKQRNKQKSVSTGSTTGFDDLRINKPEPSSTAIMDICRQMERQRFLIRPPYQRNEVINQKKSSSIIESILLGIKLPPIFIYKRKDEISEVLDGQQRLLSILGFIKKPYLDEKGKKKFSAKDGYSLKLKNSILKNLNGKRFEELDQDHQEKIKNFDLWVIEINYKNNVNFEPIDLFIRLNNKPYPIKEDTFEMWNSYISRDIIKTIKSIHSNYKDWFYLRKNNSRMEDENIYTSLAYLHFNSISKTNMREADGLDIYRTGERIAFRILSKNDITKVLEDVSLKDQFIEAANDLEFDFIKKVKELITTRNDVNSSSLNKNLDDIFNVENGRRTQQSFYALWYFLHEVPLAVVIDQKENIRKSLKKLFISINNVPTKEKFEAQVLEFKTKYGRQSSGLFDLVDVEPIRFVNLGDISNVKAGFNTDDTVELSNSQNRDAFNYYKKTEIEDWKVVNEASAVIKLIPDKDESSELNAILAGQKIVIKKISNFSNRFTVAMGAEKSLFGTDIIMILPTRYGFIPKYLCAILGSRATYFNYAVAKDTDKPLSLGFIKDIRIPYLDVEIQKQFEKVFNYLLLLGKEKSDGRLFFERLLDAMVYETYFKNEFVSSGIQIIETVKGLPYFSESVSQDDVEEVFLSISNPAHSLMASLFKMLVIDRIKEIES